MGCGSSSQFMPKVYAAHKLSITQTRIEKALSKKRQEYYGHEKKPGGKLTLESIVLKFQKVKKAFLFVKEIFNSLAESGGLNFDGLIQAMAKLHGEMTANEIRNVFEFVDLDSNKTISLKEFLVALTVGYVLEVVPPLRASMNSNNSHAINGAIAAAVGTNSSGSSIHSPTAGGGVITTNTAANTTISSGDVHMTNAPSADVSVCDISSRSGLNNNANNSAHSHDNNSGNSQNSPANNNNSNNNDNSIQVSTSARHPKPPKPTPFATTAGQLGVTLSTKDQLKEMCNLIVTAYILFDKEGNGYIKKNAIERIMEENLGGSSEESSKFNARRKSTSASPGGEENSGTANSHSKSSFHAKHAKSHSGGGIISQEKWNEMDWDSNGTIDFAEFVFSFATWVDVDQTLDDDINELNNTPNPKDNFHAPHLMTEGSAIDFNNVIKKRKNSNTNGSSISNQDKDNKSTSVSKSQLDSKGSNSSLINRSNSSGGGVGSTGNGSSAVAPLNSASIVPASDGV